MTQNSVGRGAAIEPAAKLLATQEADLHRARKIVPQSQLAT
eukprot:CAMPEP_0115281474 /NCGR_PEP_ID=MMETSP0270-20121206/59339_1 /TAXON_ID=71861 /ORGANISM="Scrippsiella trochoidea, Strain CCMP3099" /LENGTH=40 /DNA_ID= /DNA_START= /DNA_END= /DNA_ORIENTATION=